MRQLHSHQVRCLVAGWIDGPIELLVSDVEFVDRVEGAQNVFAGAQTEGPQENRAQKLALAVNAHIEDVLLVVLEFHPRAAVRNDLAEEVGAVVGGLEEHAGRAVQLADDHALGAVHDERAVLGHQGHVAEKNFLLLDVADGTVTGFGVLLVNGETHRDL